MDRAFDPNLKDVFSGEERVRSFSAGLAIGRGEGIEDAEIAAVLGECAVAPFRYALEGLAGIVRRTTGEPAFCHSADIALRAMDLLYSPRVIQVALLHDTVEDRSKKLSEVAAYLDELGRLFGEQIARDVRHSTNTYSLIIRALESKMPPNLPFDDSSRRLLRETLASQRHELPFELARMFQHEYSQLLDYFLLNVDLSGGARKARIDRKYTVVSELRLLSYRLYVEDIQDDARFRDDPRGLTLHEENLVVKTLDLVDNLRTSEVANFGSLERILLKVETFLDCTFFLHDYIRERPSVRSSFIDLYDYLKYHLVEQLIERKRALVFLADTRFACLAEYLMREVSRLSEKYKVTQDPLPELARIRERVRTVNSQPVLSKP